MGDVVHLTPTTDLTDLRLAYELTDRALAALTADGLADGACRLLIRKIVAHLIRAEGREKAADFLAMLSVRTRTDAPPTEPRPAA